MSRLDYGGQPLQELELRQWIEKRISEEPQRFGADDGGHHLTAEYVMAQIADGGQVTAYTMSQIETVLRHRRRVLDANPAWDFRSDEVKRQGGNRPDRIILSLFDLDQWTLKALEFLRRNPHRLEDTAPRIRKSIRGFPIGEVHRIELAKILFTAGEKRKSGRRKKSQNSEAGGQSRETPPEGNGRGKRRSNHSIGAGE